MLSGKLRKVSRWEESVTAEQFRTWIAPVSQFAAVLVVAGTVIFWGITLQAKVDKLEAQLHAALITPNSQAANSVSAACSNLADRAATAYAEHNKYGDQAAAQIRGLMSEIGCLQPTGK
jgi:hypothetical protein